MPRLRPVVAIAAFGLTAASAATIALADTLKGNAMTTTAITQPVAAPINAYMPAGYKEVARRPVTVDKEGAERT